jgi:hypothetical protein
VVALVSALVGFGYVYPQPGCCGSGSATMLLSADAKSVVVIAPFDNASGQTLRVNGIDVDLPGATVLGVQLDETWDGPVLPVEPSALPATIGGHATGRVVITFLPDRCPSPDAPPPSGRWGEVVLDLDVDNGRLPSLGRRYRLPGPVGGLVAGGLDVLPPNNDPALGQITDPLAAACALLDAAP